MTPIQLEPYEVIVHALKQVIVWTRATVVILVAIFLLMLYVIVRAAP